MSNTFFFFYKKIEWDRIMNTALIFIKPHAATAGVEDYLVQRLSDFHIAVVKRGTAV